MITDKDSGTMDRSNPTPHKLDQMSHSSLMAKGTNSTNYITPGSNQSTLSAGKNGQFTIVQTGNFTTTQNYATTNPGTASYASDFFNIYQVPHNLGYTPGILAYELSGSGQYSPLPYNKFAAGTSQQVLWSYFTIYADNVNVYLQLVTMTYGNVSWNFTPGYAFKWYLLYQTSN